jgi:Uncharacterised nucleotidyltransferase
LTSGRLPAGAATARWRGSAEGRAANEARNRVEEKPAAPRYVDTSTPSTTLAVGAGRPEAGAPSRPAVVLSALDALIDGARTHRGLEYHGLQLLAARRWRALGRPVPRRFSMHERKVAATWLGTPPALQRIRAAYDGDLLLLKGPEVAVTYPDPVLRPYRDLDLLASDPGAAQRALIASGFDPVPNQRRYDDLHHLRPLQIPGLPLKVEVHHAAKWPAGLEPPQSRELLAIAVPSRCGVEGVLGLAPAPHAIFLAAHAWAHAPLGKVRHLLDIALVAGDAHPADLDSFAERWGASHIWAATVRAVNALFGGGRSPATVRLWARHLSSVRERTVFEKHLTSWVSPCWGLTASDGLRHGAAALAADLRPAGGERWPVKLRRTRLALANASMNASGHDALLRERELSAAPPLGGGDRPPL